MLAAQAIKAGDAEVVVAGGQESMSQRAALRVRHAQRHQGRQPDHGRRHDPRRALGFVRLLPHGRVRRVHGREGRGESRGPGRVRLRQSTGKRLPRTEPGSSRPRSLPVQVPGKSGPTTIVGATRRPARTPRAESLARLKPAFKKDGGTVTAGNAPGLNDGSSALVVTSLAFAKAHGLAPMARVTGVRDRRRRAARSLLRAGRSPCAV